MHDESEVVVCRRLSLSNPLQAERDVSNKFEFLSPTTPDLYEMY
jgi:hypothetical protein